jgi:predicted SAM-dependent methyltransferase
MVSTSVNLGSGDSKRPEEIGVDFRITTCTDVVADLEAVHLPFKDNSVDSLRSYHTLEHLSDLIGIMEEIYRICKNGATVDIAVPYFSHSLNFRDPTHKRLFSWGMFDFFVLPDKRYQYSHVHFEYVSKTLRFTAGLNALIGRFLFWLSPRRYDKYYAYRYPAFEYKVLLCVVK